MIERERCIDTSNDELDESLSTSMSLDHDTTVSMPDLGNLIQFSNHAIKKFDSFIDNLYIMFKIVICF